MSESQLTQSKTINKVCAKRLIFLKFVIIINYVSKSAAKVLLFFDMTKK